MVWRKKKKVVASISPSKRQKINSRAKGCRGELEVAKIFTDFGFKARRGQQFSGGTDSPDIVFDSLGKYIHAEVKRTENTQYENYMVQAERDALKTQIATIIHRRSGESWKAIVRLEYFLELLKLAFPDAWNDPNQSVTNEMLDQL